MDYLLQDLTDGEAVVLSANLLDTSEFEIFRHAHGAWFGTATDDQDLEGEFSRYLHTGHAPPWVRHHTRTLLLKDDQTIHIISYRPTPGRWFEWLLNTRVARLIFG